jgi:hypothetical protein
MTVLYDSLVFLRVLGRSPEQLDINIEKEIFLSIADLLQEQKQVVTSTTKLVGA